MDPLTIGLTLASAGGSLLSGMGAAQSSKKQARLQQIAENEARRLNEEQQRYIADERRRLGQEMLAVEEVHENESSSGNWVDVDGMMAAAERSGFNPVTWLNAGGMQAYQQSWSLSKNTSRGHNAADAYKLMLPEMLVTSAGQVPQQHSMLSAFGGALSAGANTFGTQYRANQSYDLQLEKLMMGQALQGMGLSQTNGLANTIRYGGGGGSSGAGVTGGSALSDLPYPDKWKPGDVEFTNPYARAFIDSNSPNAETGEARYGEVGEFLFGMRNIVNDSIRNLTGASPEYWGTVAGMNIGSYKQPKDTSWGPAFSRWWNSPTSAASTFGPAADSAWRTGWQNLQSLGLVQ